MKITIKAIKNFDEFLEKIESHRDNPDVFEKPTPDYIDTIVNFKDKDVKDYIIKPLELCDGDEREIEITLKTKGKSPEILKAIWTQKIEDELDSILAISNERFREIK